MQEIYLEVRGVGGDDVIIMVRTEKSVSNQVINIAVRCGNA